MHAEILVIGYGPVGRATVARLLAEGRHVRIAQRVRPDDLPQAVPFTAVDVRDAASVAAAMAGADQAVIAIGFVYDGKVWTRDWPRAMRNLLAAAETHGTRLVFVDNLYMYGPQTEPLREDMPLTAYGQKPSARAEVTRLWQAATGRVRIAALRAPDFYGPGVTQSHLGALAFGALARGKAAQLVVPDDTPHEVAYVPDIARAVVELLDAPDTDYGQAWHMPSAPTTTLREIIGLGAAAIGTSPRFTSLPFAVQPLVGLFVPMLREMHEMRFQWDRPYVVDAQRFTARFGFVPTPFAVGAAATARSFLPDRPAVAAEAAAAGGLPAPRPL
jgi:nucleoside-diphosphate-sugar epimerase